MEQSTIPSRTTRVKRLAINQRVSGKFGALIQDDRPGKRAKRAQLFGTVVEAINEKLYRVRFDDNTVQECYSNSLRVEDGNTNPPDLPPLQPNDTNRLPPTFPPTLNQELGGELAEDNALEDEHLPEFRPEDDDTSEAPEEETEHADDAHDHPLPVGQIEPAGEVLQPNYFQRKEQAQESIRRLL